jgi:hypothetical protein
MSEERKGTSPWIYIGVGCLVAVLLVFAVIFAIGWWGFSQVREWQRTLEDPQARTELASEMLAAEQIPPGYHAVMAMSIPFLMETVVLSDRPPDEDGDIQGFGERGFIYFKTLSVGQQEQELRDFFEGNADDPQVLDQTSIRIDAREMIGRGTIEEAERTLRWVSYRGEIRGGNADFGEGLNTMVMFECPAAERLRMGIWFGPDPDPDAPLDATQLAGTVADPAEIQRFMGHFDVCSR